MLGEHRDHLVNQVDTRAAFLRLLVERRFGPDKVADVGDVDAEDAVTMLIELHRDGVIEIPRGRGVDGDDVGVADILALAGAGEALGNPLRLVDHRGREGVGQFKLPHHHLGIEGRFVRRADHVDDLAFRRHIPVVPTREPQDHPVALLRAVGGRDVEIFLVNRIQRDDIEEF